MRPIAVRCPAKINTRLSVLGRRPDGYHELDLDFVTLELADTLEVAAGPELRLEVHGAAPGTVPVDENLVMRAASLLRDEVGRGRLPGAHMSLIKRTPVAAGLGGGSSDAAGALLGLAKLWSLEVPEAVLAAIALEVGSDVPFFLRGGWQTGCGRGERLSPQPDRDDRDVLLVVSSRGLSTASVFQELVRRRTADGNAALTSRKPGTSFPLGVSGAGEPASNDLLEAALALAPELKERLETILREVPGGLVGLTGSGPTLFAMLEPGSPAADIFQGLDRAVAGGARVMRTRTMGAAELSASRWR